ncbi:uncharacterized protein PITG_01350 [Phytophthora infestans T30-4]|uniref:Uncharacterized protein n=1 Tax=Phytophthora infestans (strain T30-4) TaxID=403677 RepID=D0MVA8_PHYIT|nr:uncharacterized protein PITG_01350 [Phytophthora infestans T30-4]EEY61104.1 conserved hypothetical protein [Phytophthora infestans T30-4]|eukprot:XP_002908021.1 conserved hypothetical protein [Phytophthora infestans T30-4]
MSSSPAVKYARYKRATAFFLDWLLRARGGGRHAGQRVQLEALNDVVKEIAADPSTLTPKLLQQLPKALAACQYAITLRDSPKNFQQKILDLHNSIMMEMNRSLGESGASGNYLMKYVPGTFLLELLSVERILFFDDVYVQEVFSPFRAAAYFMAVAGRPIAGESGQQRVNRALEESVIKVIMPLLDALLPDGRIDKTAIPRKAVSDEVLAKEMCKRVANVIKTRFTVPSGICEQKGPNHDNIDQVFADLMKLLMESDGPLSATEMAYVKSEIKENYDLLGIVAPTTESAYDEFCTLLHLAAVGPAHDMELVEWMIQLGAFIVQPLHCRMELHMDNGKFPTRLTGSKSTFAPPMTKALRICDISIYQRERVKSLHPPNITTTTRWMIKRNVEHSSEPKKRNTAVFKRKERRKHQHERRFWT